MLCASLAFFSCERGIAFKDSQSTPFPNVEASLRSELFASAVVRLAIGLLGLEATRKARESGMT